VGAALGSLGLTLVLVIARPAIGRFGRMNPVIGAIPGVLLMLATRVLTPSDVLRGATILWKPLVTIASIMATTSMAHRLGIFDRVTRSIEIRTRGPVTRAFTAVYVICATTAALFNNDAAVLLLTPIVLPVIRRLYPKRSKYLVVPFAFAVFMSAGVAPLCTSNPMNLVVAEHAGIGFNAYALRMAPVAFAGSVCTYVVLRVLFKKELEDAVPARGPELGSLADMGSTSRGVLVIVAAMFASYPILSYFDAPVWIAALAGATLTCIAGVREQHVTAAHVVHGVAWDILAFLFLIFVTALGLENIGVTVAMSRVYGVASVRGADGIGLVGVVSALGSAIVNNHPMAALNALALRSLDSGHSSLDTQWRTLAALVGGDLGPRLLPMGSLAGLLWLEMGRRLGVEIRTSDFVRTGFLVTIPALSVSLAVLWLETLILP
jgi:arsenical pump membrane protein